MSVDGVLDGQLVQVENVGYRLHLMVVGFVKADPDEGGHARLLELPNLRQGRRVRVLAGQSRAVRVDAAIDHGARHRYVDRRGVWGCPVSHRGPQQRRLQCAEGWHTRISDGGEVRKLGLCMVRVGAENALTADLGRGQLPPLAAVRKLR